MKKILWAFLFCYMVLSSSQAVADITITLDPHVSKVHASENVFVDINISGLQSDGVDALLGAWELDFKYDPSVFQFFTGQPAGLGTALGDVFLGEAISLAQPVTTPGVFHVGVLSLLEADLATCVFCIDPLLEDLQSDSFTLATVGLFALPTGFPGTINTFFATDNIVLSDAFGNELSPVAPMPEPVKVVPIPATVILIGIGLLGWGAARRGHKFSFLPVF